MYQPDSFRTNDPLLVRGLLREYPFATLLTDGGREINHMPLLLREDHGDSLVLEGHAAVANSLGRRGSEEIVVIFQGPDAYVSPTWYVSPGQVPTWNYMVVHARGRIAPTENPDEARAAMERFVARFEGEGGWSMDGLPKRALDGMFAAIRPFRIDIDSFEAKFKLSQNRAPADQAAVLRRLEESADPRHLAMARVFRIVNSASLHS